MLEVTRNPKTQHYEAVVDGVIWSQWISGYCGRLFSRADGTAEYMAEMNDGTLVKQGTLDELRWMVGHYHRNHRFGTSPHDASMRQLSGRNDSRPNFKNGNEYH